MRENLFNSAHKASNEKSRAGWDRTFKVDKGKDRGKSNEQSTYNLKENKKE